MAPPSADLRKIGLEGFALIDKFYPTRRSSANEPAVKCKDAAVLYGGISVVNYPKGKPTNRWGRPIKL